MLDAGGCLFVGMGPWGFTGRQSLLGRQTAVLAL